MYVYVTFQAGGTKVISTTVLHATDIDSDDDSLTYVVTVPVHLGELYLDNGDTMAVANNFTPAQLASGEFNQQTVWRYIYIDITP